MGSRKELYHVYLMNKETKEETYLSSHKRSKDAHAQADRTVRQKSPKKFDCIVKYH